jgi:UDP-glucose 4-epimerase
MAKVLVTGGCGYIGSHTIVDLINKGYEIISVDNFINSNPDAYAGITQITGIAIKHYPVDLCNLLLTESIFEENPDIDSIIHFAALKSVKESVDEPVKYFRNNLGSLINLLYCCEKYNIKNFIFSSSCTVYGNPDQLPVTEESTIKKAESPYGKTKQISERLIAQAAYKTSLKAISLRYFNPAGAHESNLIGESPIVQAVNLVPVITETAIGKRAEMMVYGNNYPTRDGTNVRDYIHVMDLANAHTLALDRMAAANYDTALDVFNLGIGQGVSVLEAITAFETTTGLSLNYKIGNRRDGDVEAIYANYDKAKRILGWEPKLDIENIMSTAWNWEKKRAVKGDF